MQSDAIGPNRALVNPYHSPFVSNTAVYLNHPLENQPSSRTSTILSNINHPLEYNHPLEHVVSSTGGSKPANNNHNNNRPRRAPMDFDGLFY